MADWADLAAELSAWDAMNIKPRLWWRDDDAQSVSPALERLLALSQRHEATIHLSVIPVGITADLPARLRDTDYTYVLQHGLRHVNHEPKGKPASEVGEMRDIRLQRDDLERGWHALVAARMPRLLPAFVPPWNRIGDMTRRHLPEWGYSFLSTYDGRGDAAPVSGLTHINAHLDPIRWKYNNVFRGEEKMLEMLLAHLKDRRANESDAPIGYVTHHLQTEDAIWELTDTLLCRTRGLWNALPNMQKDV